MLIEFGDSFVECADRDLDLYALGSCTSSICFGGQSGLNFRVFVSGQSGRLSVRLVTQVKYCFRSVLKPVWEVTRNSPGWFTTSDDNC